MAIIKIKLHIPEQATARHSLAEKLIYNNVEKWKLLDSISLRNQQRLIQSLIESEMR